MSEGTASKIAELLGQRSQLRQTLRSAMDLLARVDVSPSIREHFIKTCVLVLDETGDQDRLQHDW